MTENQEWNYQQMTGANSMGPSNPSGHPMIVPQSEPTRQPVELPVGRPAMVPRAELEAVERERDEAMDAWKRVSLEAEHWLSIASKRKDERDKAREQLDRLAEALKLWRAEGPESNACFCDAQFAMHGAHPRHSPECEASMNALAIVKGGQS